MCQIRSKSSRWRITPRQRSKMALKVQLVLIVQLLYTAQKGVQKTIAARTSQNTCLFVKLLRCRKRTIKLVVKRTINHVIKNGNPNIFCASMRFAPRSIQLSPHTSFWNESSFTVVSCNTAGTVKGLCGSRISTRTANQQFIFETKATLTGYQCVRSNEVEDLLNVVRVEMSHTNEIRT